MIINYHGIDVSTSFYNDACNQVLEFKIFLAKKYTVPLSLISWEHVSEYMNELVKNQQLIVQCTNATDKFSGLTKFIGDRFLIIVNTSPKINNSRLRFTLTHELMHIILHHSELDLGFKIKLQPSFINITEEERELQADFAANDLLMSSWLIKDRMSRGYSFERLKDSFQVSWSAMQTRLHNYLVFEIGIDFDDARKLTNLYRYCNDKTICSYVSTREDFIHYFVNFCEMPYPPSIEDIESEAMDLLPVGGYLNHFGIELIKNDIENVLLKQMTDLAV